jgi:hypothetical protein
MTATQAEVNARASADKGPWPRVKWDQADLIYVAETLQVINPLGFKDADSLASYIRSLSETELYRNQGPMDISTGGWTVCFFRAWDTVADRYDYCAVVTISAYTAHRYVMSQLTGRESADQD